MTTISNAFINALLADTTYALQSNNLNGFTGSSLTNLPDVKDRMTPTLAKYIGDNFTVKTHIETGDLLGSGFDATVWRANNPDGTANLNGKLYLSMQGTTGLGDLLSDIDLATSGNARNQLADMVNWWLSISTPLGQQATQITVIGGAFFAATAVAGQGLVTAAELANGMEVNGHSLGGYLATAFTRLFGSEAHVSHTSNGDLRSIAMNSVAVYSHSTGAGGQFGTKTHRWTGLDSSAKSASSPRHYCASSYRKHSDTLGQWHLAGVRQTRAEGGAPWLA